MLVVLVGIWGLGGGFDWGGLKGEGLGVWDGWVGMEF